MMRSHLSMFLCTAAAATAIAACNPYDPSFPAEPFRCGTDEPECPDGYVCDERSPSDKVCVLEGNGPDVDGGGEGDAPFFCLDDSQIEPNDTINTATVVPIPDLGDSYQLQGLAICPDIDLDVFRFRIAVTGKNATVDVAYDASRGQLQLDILNSGGQSIREGTADPGNPDLLTAAVSNLPAGIYYAQLQPATTGIENNYGITITTTGP
jgi:hypothetical protein